MTYAVGASIAASVAPPGRQLCRGVPDDPGPACLRSDVPILEVPARTAGHFGWEPS